jgi:hypothetical protein
VLLPRTVVAMSSSSSAYHTCDINGRIRFFRNFEDAYNEAMRKENKVCKISFGDERFKFIEGEGWKNFPITPEYGYGERQKGNTLSNEDFFRECSKINS